MPEHYRETTGEVFHLDTLDEHKKDCSGFLGKPDDDSPKPCPRCKPALAARLRDSGSTATDHFAESTPSFRAADAIRRADAKDQR